MYNGRMVYGQAKLGVTKLSKATRQLNPLRLCVLGLILLAFLAACGSDMSSGARTSPETDREALVAFYNATDGPNWHNNKNWLSDLPIGEWSGVASKEGHVSQLDLTKNGLRGEIPAGLGDLINLKRLWLDRNNLTGEMPAELGNLSSLERLRLSHTSLTGEIPAELGNLASLKSLHLSQTNLTGEIPAELGNLANLETLWLGFNRLNGEIPPELGNLANLKWLFLRSQRI